MDNKKTTDPENGDFNVYELEKFSETDEELAIINLLEDLQTKYAELENSNQLLTKNRKAIANILDDTASLNKKIGEERAKLQAILSNMGDGLYVVDRDERIILQNGAMEKIFGWNFSDIANKKDSEIFPKIRFANAQIPDECGLPCLVHKHWKNGKTANLSYVALPPKKGEEVIASISAAPIFDEKKNIIAGVITIRDMRHEFEIDRAKTEFVSVASHQLRTPLAAIKWFLELLLEGEAGRISSHQKDFLSQISDSTERMIDLVNALLNVSRIETGRILIEPQATDLIKLAEKAITEIKSIIDKRNQKLKLISPQKTLPAVNIDPRLIFEVFINLLSNASKYTPEKGSITLEILPVEKEIMFRIADTGYGIPAHQQHRVFEKFFRGENIMRYATEGTGLGLYIVKAIVEASGGRIWFESQENKGTVFYFTLPLEGSQEKKGEKSIELTKRFI